MVTIPAAVTGYVRKYDASNAGLYPGDQLTARQLLAALLLPSGSDAAYALAAAYGPGLAAFTARMNATATRLGMAHTHFANFDGLPWPTEYSTYSTPADLITLGRAAMRYPAFQATVDHRPTRSRQAPGTTATCGATPTCCSPPTPGRSASRRALPGARGTACCSRPSAARPPLSAWSWTARPATRR